MWHVLLAAMLAVTPADPPLPNPYRDVPPERNAWTQLYAAIGRMVNDLGETRDYPSLSDPLRPALVTYITHNRAALERFDAAIASPEMALSPADLARGQAGEEERFRTYAKIRELTRMKVQRAYQRQAQGDRVGAANDVCGLLRFERLWNRGCESVIGALVSRVPGSYARAVSGVLLGPPPPNLPLADHDPTVAWPLRPITGAERTLWLEAIGLLGDDSLVVGYRSALGGEYLERCLNRGSLPSMKAKEPAFEELYRALSVEAGTVAAKRDKGRLGQLEDRAGAKTGDEDVDEVLEMGATTPWMVLHQTDEAVAARRLCAVAIALRLYAGDHGRLPTELDALVRDQLVPALPRSPITDEPITYLPREGRLVMPGANLYDSQPNGICWLSFVRERPWPIYRREPAPQFDFGTPPRRLERVRPGDYAVRFGSGRYR